jgi:hypothetical protein
MDIKIAKYMAESYRPCCISAPLREWKNLTYNCHLFRVKTKILTEDDKKYYHPSYLENAPNIEFTCVENSGSETFVIHPVEFLHSILDRSTVKYLHKLFVDTENDDEYVTFDTCGNVQIRWILMLKDFAFKNAKVHIGSSISFESILEHWTNVIALCPGPILDALIEKCFKMMHYSKFRVNVLKAPVYDMSQFTTSELRPARLKELEDRTWCTKDGCASLPACAFFETSSDFMCLGNLPDKFDGYTLFIPTGHNMQYDILYSCEGGISMRFTAHMPWYNITQALLGHGLGYCDVRGHDTYNVRKDVPIEELVVLAAALKHEGAEIEVKYIPFH